MFLLYIAMVGLLFPMDAWAYIDPGTGSLWLQMVLGVLIGGMAFFKGHLARFFKRPVKPSGAEHESQD